MNIFEKIKVASSRLFTKSYHGLFSMGSSWASQRWSLTTQMSQFKNSAIVYACVKKRTDKLSQLIKFEVKNLKGKVLEKHWLYDLLEKPNEMQSGKEFLAKWQMYKDLAGVAYILKMGDNPKKPKELHLLRPDLVEIVKDNATGLITKFRYNKASGNGQEYEPEQVIASFNINPLDLYEPLSPLVPGQDVVETEQQLTTYHYKILKNGGKPEGILKVKTKFLEQEEIEQIHNRFMEQYGGADNAGKPIVLYGDGEYQNLGLTPTELSYLDSKKFTQQEVMMMFGVPKTILGLTEDISRANGVEANRMFIADTIKPLMEDLVDKLNMFLAPDDVQLGFIDPVPKDVELLMKKTENGTKNFYMTINEKREIMGLEPLSDKIGNKILIPFNLVDIEEMRQKSDSGADKGLKRAVKFNHPLKDKDKRDIYGKLYLKRFEKHSEIMLKAVKKFFKEQEKRVLEAVESKAKALEDEAFNLGLEIDLTKEAFLPILTELLKEAGIETFAGLDSDFEFVLSSRVLSALDKRVDIFAKSINETTFDKLKSEFAQSFAEDEGQEKLQKRIQGVYGDISKGRAKVIADTETQVANQMGIYEAYKQGNLPVKIWVTTIDGKERDSHHNIDGEEQPIDMPFSNGLNFPGDPDGPAGEVINCRCTI